MIDAQIPPGKAFRLRPLVRSALALLGILCALTTIGAAQTSSSLIQSDPKAQYSAIKNTMQHLYESGALRSEIGIKEKDTYDLYNCSSGYDFIGPAGGDDKLMTLTTLALQVVVWRNDLQKLGYPASVWQPAVSEFENKQFDLVLRESGQTFSESPPSERNFVSTTKRLAALLNAYQRNGHPSLLPAISEGGCGAGDFAINVSTEPSDGRVFFIPAFFHELCRAQKLDPDDTVRCDRWHEALNGELTYVAGDYYYIARWPDGAVRQGRLGFTHLREGQKVILRKQ